MQAIADPDERVRRVIELNVQEQCLSLFNNSIVQAAQAKAGRPRVHGFVYDVADGHLRPLKIDFRSQVDKYRQLYEVYDFDDAASSGEE